jgi:hydroxymethylpyrimidine pyrophosphatase-like HAD family hydrolase
MKSIVDHNIVYKLGLYIDEDGAKGAYEEMVKIPGMTSCFSLDTLVDIFNEKASKGNAMMDLAKTYGYNKDEVMALGDNENDIPMIQAAGLGIAMADAREQVKASADEIAESNNSSGVAKMIKKHLNL